jgi:uncharacterized membrane protein YsdA (DUF1294 family)
MKLLYLYLIIVNAVGLILMLVDKQKARKNQWRIREATLFLVAAIGGSIGTYAGMQLFRHKTKHPSFTIGIPVIIIIQILIAMGIFHLF